MSEEPRNYTNPECRTFVYFMECEADVYHYRGRFGWEGPAANFDSMSDAVDAYGAMMFNIGVMEGRGDPMPDWMQDTVRVQFDSMGLGVVMYTVAKDAGTA